ncbi:hypothetical protein [Thalassospira alkalitolerans]
MISLHGVARWTAQGQVEAMLAKIRNKKNANGEPWRLFLNFPLGGKWRE